jgi:prolyl-tRNA editing enzyme YbaK/EbsC (Cys-tRNA(Pro) deacylase)
MWAPLTGAPGARWRRDTSLMTEIGNSVERVRAALQKAGHPDTIEVFADGTRTAEEAAAAVGCTVAQIAKSIVLRAGNQVVLVMTSGVNRVDVEKISRALGVKAKAADGRWVRDTTGFAIGGVAPVGHMGCPRVFIDVDLMTLDPIWGRRRLAASCVSQHADGAGPPDGRRDCRCEGRMIGAGEGIRTLDPDLGKVVLYP